MFLVLAFTPQVCCLGRFLDFANEIAVTLESMTQETLNLPRHVRLSKHDAGNFESAQTCQTESLLDLHIYSGFVCVCVKRREVSWTLTKKLAQKRSRAGRWCWTGERELDFFCFSCFPVAELQTLSLWLFCVSVGTAIVWCGGHCAVPDGHCLSILLFWRQSTAALVFGSAPVSTSHSSIPLFPLVPVPNRPSRLHGR